MYVHLLLRITDVLTRNLEQQRHPAWTDGQKASWSNQKLWSVIVHDKKVFSFTSLVGGDKVKLLKKLPSKLKDCQPADFSTKVKDLWKVRYY